MKLLIVEDEAILAVCMRMELEAAGFQVVGIADRREQALEIAERHRPAVVLMDILIKGDTNGIELTEIFARKYPEVKVIYMTAHSDEATIEKARRTHHAGFLKKPFEMHKFQQVLHSVDGNG